MQITIIKTFKTSFMLWIFILACLVQTSCKKQIEVEAPPTSINSENVYASDATAASVLTGIYSEMSNQNTYNPASSGPTPYISTISIFTGLSSDELTLYGNSDPSLPPYYQNNLNSIRSGGEFWSQIYPIIFDVNAAIEGLNNSSGLTPTIKQQLLGEAKFLRAFCYFYLTNLYGDLPLPTSTDYKTNAVLPRAPKAQVFQQIISDLKDAQNLLSANYLDATILTTTTERVRPTEWAAHALLARAYLYTGSFDSADAEATLVINNSSLYSLDSLNQVFLKNSAEAIWQLQPVNTGFQSNTGDGGLFILPSTGPNGNNYPVYLSNNVVNSFEANDLRRINWVDSVIAGSITYYYAYKYKIGSIDTATGEYLMVLRLGEQYLIRAEARTQQNKISEAQSDLNVIRLRAGLLGTSANDQASLMTAILHERQVELFTEWGNRWFDLQRTNSITSVMSTVTNEKGGSWSSFKALYPIPQSEITLDLNLVQTPGY